MFRDARIPRTTRGVRGAVFRDTEDVISNGLSTFQENV